MITQDTLKGSCKVQIQSDCNLGAQEEQQRFLLMSSLVLTSCYHRNPCKYIYLWCPDRQVWSDQSNLPCPLGIPYAVARGVAWHAPSQKCNYALCKADSSSCDWSIEPHVSAHTLACSLNTVLEVKGSIVKHLEIPWHLESTSFPLRYTIGYYPLIERIRTEVMPAGRSVSRMRCGDLCSYTHIHVLCIYTYVLIS